MHNLVPCYINPVLDYFPAEEDGTASNVTLVLLPDGDEGVNVTIAVPDDTVDPFHPNVRLVLGNATVPPERFPKVNITAAVDTKLTIVLPDGQPAEDRRPRITRVAPGPESESIVVPSNCTDMPPPGSDFNCRQQREFGKCGEYWMLEGNYCAYSCGREPCPRRRP